MWKSNFVYLGIMELFTSFYSVPTATTLPFQPRLRHHFQLLQHDFEFSKPSMSESKQAFMASFLAKMVVGSSWNKVNNCVNCC